ncbi:hypothetical protein PCANC_11009 [Puccinia coronata f. sp. avenae]|uniref:Uncharacterized protein n=1 Tax=Puccinia coronata f. sp. avenae TaxID=200324 RepID=A0A2N5UTB2_9BASI|nr:hypothetical protein PCASD_10169 [Puccinia coronata f. sp. avenae]PLW40867.1 hypothetical protein PCANC_11009 [Puccinia coronata f. sp. avenae]
MLHLSASDGGWPREANLPPPSSEASQGRLAIPGASDKEVLVHLDLSTQHRSAHRPAFTPAPEFQPTIHSCTHINLRVDKNAAFHRGSIGVIRSGICLDSVCNVCPSGCSGHQIVNRHDGEA